MDVESLIKFWDKVITGQKISDTKSPTDNPDDIKSFLYERSLLVMPKVAKATGFGNINLNNDKKRVVKEIFSASTKLPDENWSFFPQRIIKTKKATCAGNTLIVNYLLKKADINFEYGRPEGHSMNFVYLGSETLWLDGANSVFERVGFTDKIIDGVKVRTIESNNSKISYRVVRVLMPRDIIINFFGNMMALKGSAGEGDEVASEIMDEHGDEINRVDLEKWLFYLYPNYMKYTTENEEFLKEAKRIKKLQKS